MPITLNNGSHKTLVRTANPAFLFALDHLIDSFFAHSHALELVGPDVFALADAERAVRGLVIHGSAFSYQPEDQPMSDNSI